jgi:DNA polymerase III epsilon subunit-like protein
MIINAWDSQFTAKYGHHFPSSYLCFDTEFTGRSERDDLIVEIGHVLVEDGKVVDRLNLVLNWYELNVVPDSWLDYKLNQMRHIVGPGWRLLPETVKKEGINPLQALRFYHKLFHTWADRGMPFVAQNGIGADEPMIRGNLNRFLNKTFEIPANSYFDTGAIFKANQIWQAQSGDLANYRSVMLPTRTETLKAYFQRICNSRIRGVHWSLKLILEHFDLIRKHKLDTDKLHNAGFDALCLYLIMEEYRSMVLPRNIPIVESPRVLKPNHSEITKVTPQKSVTSAAPLQSASQQTPRPLKRQRLI